MIQSILEQLDQGKELIHRIGDDLYQRRPAVHMPPVGAHFRHYIDFYDRFFEGVALGRIDYDARIRQKELETDRRVALICLAEVQENVGCLDISTLGHEVLVSQDRHPLPKDDPEAWSRSSVKRELQFLMGHTIHHHAIIGEILRLQGFEPDPSFGVSPSSLDFMKK